MHDTPAMLHILYGWQPWSGRVREEGGESAGAPKERPPALSGWALPEGQGGRSRASGRFLPPTDPRPSLPLNLILHPPPLPVAPAAPPKAPEGCWRLRHRTGCTPPPKGLKPPPGGHSGTLPAAAGSPLLGPRRTRAAKRERKTSPGRSTIPPADPRPASPRQEGAPGKGRPCRRWARPRW